MNKAPESVYNPRASGGLGGPQPVRAVRQAPLSQIPGSGPKNRVFLSLFFIWGGWGLPPPR